MINGVVIIDSGASDLKPSLWPLESRTQYATRNGDARHLPHWPRARLPHWRFKAELELLDSPSMSRLSHQRLMMTIKSAGMRIQDSYHLFESIGGRGKEVSKRYLMPNEIPRERPSSSTTRDVAKSSGSKEEQLGFQTLIGEDTT